MSKLIPYQRREAIITELIQKKSCTVMSLSKLLCVSDVTINRDLATLEQSGIINRVRGGAKIADSYGEENPKVDQRIDVRLRIQVDEKKEIARKAALLIHDESSIFIDHSSSGIYLARELMALPFRNLVLITNSVKILTDLEGCKFNVISTGGILMQKWGALGGQGTLDFLKMVNLDQAFVSCGGISIKRGLMTSFPFVAENLKLASKVSREINLLVDSSKFSKIGTFSIMPVNALARIITDNKLEPVISEQFRKVEIKII